MVWQYLLVFAGALLVDIVPFPFPPAFTLMIFLQITFHLNIWLVIFLGVAGSIAGRYLLAMYIGKLSGKIFKDDKNDDARFLGKKIREKGWKGKALIFLYTMMPLPST